MKILLISLLVVPTIFILAHLSLAEEINEAALDEPRKCDLETDFCIIKWRSKTVTLKKGDGSKAYRINVSEIADKLPLRVLSMGEGTVIVKVNGEIRHIFTSYIKLNTPLKPPAYYIELCKERNTMRGLCSASK